MGGARAAAAARSTTGGHASLASTSVPRSVAPRSADTAHAGTADRVCPNAAQMAHPALCSPAVRVPIAAQPDAVAEALLCVPLRRGAVWTGARCQACKTGHGAVCGRNAASEMSAALERSVRRDPILRVRLSDPEPADKWQAGSYQSLAPSVRHGRLDIAVVATRADEVPRDGALTEGMPVVSVHMHMLGHGIREAHVG